MTDEEFERLYGRPPVKPGTHRRVKIYWGRIIIALIILVLIICGIVQLISSIVRHFSGEDTKPAVVNSAVEDQSGTEKSESQAESEPDVIETAGWQFKVCIDAGHGGEDDGACLYDDDYNVIRKEKDDTLKIALLIRDHLKEKGVNVVMTRETDMWLGDDVDTDLKNRCLVTNDSRCDLFVSIHRDSVSSDVSGFEACVHSKQPEMDTILATNILTNLQAVGISTNRGIVYGFTDDHSQNYYVNADTVCPSVLMEMGFITSENDNKLIDEKAEEYAVAIGDAIIKTAQDLGVVDKNGKRLLNDQLISRTKLYYPLETYYSNGDASAAG